MGILEEEARFLVTKYGTAHGPVGVSTELREELFIGAATLPAWFVTAVIILGFLVCLLVVFVLVRDVIRARREEDRIRREFTYATH